MDIVDFTVYRNIITNQTYITKKVAEKFDINYLSSKTIEGIEYVEVTNKDILNIVEKTKNTTKKYNPIYKNFKQNMVNLKLKTNEEESVIKDNTELFVNRKLYEKAQKEKIEIEGKPKVIQNRNYYSITKEQLETLKKENNRKSKYLIVYRDKVSNKSYIKEEDLKYKKDNPKTIMGNICYEVTDDEINKLNKKVLPVSVYLKQEDKIEITITSLNNTLYIPDKFVTNKDNKKRIRIDGVLYTSVTDDELAILKKQSNRDIVFTKKSIKKNNELNDMFKNTNVYTDTKEKNK